MYMNSLVRRDRTIETTQDSDFEDFWRIYPRRPGDNKKEAFRQWQARLKQGENTEIIMAGTRRYADYCAKTIDDPKFYKKAATFLGRDQHYLLEWATSK